VEIVARRRPLMTLVGRQRRQAYSVSAASLFGRTPLVLWQDGQTASAAEALIAAPSFGKGTRQAFVELSDGSALRLTDGRLRSPAGTAYDGHGLTPSASLQGAAHTTRPISLPARRG